MRMTLLVHILAGGLGLVLGAVALSATKGATLHRKGGMLFVLAMLTTTFSGVALAASIGEETSVTGGLLTAYMVVTGLTTVRPPSAGSRWLGLGAMLVALAVGLADVAMGLETLAGGGFTREGVPVPMLFVFGAIALLASAGDLRVIRSGGLRGPRRIARHLYRMCLALFFASASFFLGQADEFPEALRRPALLAIPAFLPLLVMVYWLWRVRIRRSTQAIVRMESEDVT